MRPALSQLRPEFVSLEMEIEKRLFIVQEGFPIGKYKSGSTQGIVTARGCLMTKE